MRKRSEGNKLGSILVANRLITPEQLEAAVELQRQVYKPLGQILVDQGWLSDRQLLHALAAQWGVSAWDLERDPPDRKVATTVPIEVCRAQGVLPVRRQGGLLTLAMLRPLDTETIDLVRNLTGCRIEPVLVAPQPLARATEKLEKELVSKKIYGVDELVREAVEGFGEDRERAVERLDLDQADSRPVVELVNQILSNAISRRATDVHIEPRLDRVEVRFRIDGELAGAMDVPVRLGPPLTTRIKIMAELDIVEHRLPQDGHLSVEVKGREVNVRVNTLPTRYGQRISLRLLDKSASLRPISQLGFTDEALVAFQRMIARPHGLVIVTGPTGSGKTTTLYSALGQVMNGRNNIMTCEDPIEYDIDGVNQSQVNEKLGLTFAAQLRAILRQDPDVILVGEIRDRETAETAIRASMTGHLVLSTLHTNDAPSAVPRLLDIGIDPYLLSTSLVGVTAQRLLRTLCGHCKREREATEDEARILASLGGSSTSLWEPVGCTACFETGYRGRQAVHEVLTATQEVRRLIADRAPIDEVAAAAAKVGYRRMQDSALSLVVESRTSLAEVQRIVALDVADARPHLRAA